MKSRTRAEHPQALAKILRRSWEHNLKMNPKKCVFGVSSSKLLGFIISKRGIEIDLNKVKVIAKMSPLENLKELRGLIGLLLFIRRFTSQHSQRCRPFYELLKGRVHFDWNDKCQQAFDGLKSYLSSPLVMKPPIPRKPLILYVLVIDDSVGAVLA